MTVQGEVGTVRLAELVATLSYATDLGRGQPMEHCMRQSVIALRMADRVGVDDSERVATYYVGLMMGVYCHADAYEQAKWFGDDISLKTGGYEAMGMRPWEMIPHFLRTVAAPGSGLEGTKRVVTLPARFSSFFSFLNTHSTLAAQFAERIGLDETVSKSLLQSYEYWNGKGHPNHVKGDDIAIATRLVQLADPVEVHHRTRGVEAAREVAQRQRGKQFDPSLVDLFCAEAPALLEDLESASNWDAVLEAEPQLSRRVGGAELDQALEAMADLVDMKSPHMAGHSRGVANLASEAGRVSGLPADELHALRRAGFIHDLGRLGVSNTIWDKPGPLTEAEFERVRLHPYLTDRMLARVSALGQCRELAARHHERLDGSGYPRGLTAPSLSPADRLLAAADVYHAMTEPRAYRAALEPDKAAAELRAEVKAGRLDGEAVNAVLAAAGQRAPARRDWPGGLTAREVEVLSLLARGHSNKEIARELTVTPKTASNHIEHIYTKLDVSTRAAATLFATQHGLVGSFEPA